MNVPSQIASWLKFILEIKCLRLAFNFVFVFITEVDHVVQVIDDRVEVIGDEVQVHDQDLDHKHDHVHREVNFVLMK
jgi:hypothetical protein